MSDFVHVAISILFLAVNSMDLRLEMEMAMAMMVPAMQIMRLSCLLDFPAALVFLAAVFLVRLCRP